MRNLCVSVLSNIHLAVGLNPAPMLTMLCGLRAWGCREESALIMASRSIRRGIIKAGPLSLSSSFPSDKNINGRMPNKKEYDFNGRT